MESKEILQTLSVVYVEDEDFMRENVGRFLKRRVAKIELASNGIEGLNMVLKNRPDIVITDIQMPKMNGIEMIRLIRKEYSKEELPIIVVSAFNDKEHHSDLANAYIYKPIAVQDLYDAIKKLARR